MTKRYKLMNRERLPPTASPTYAKVLEGVKLVQQVGMILGVGGGPVMDCCKAISIAARYEGDAWENFWARPGIKATCHFAVTEVCYSLY